MKRCACGRVHDPAAWAALPLVGIQDPEEPDAIELRNCPCGSTIAVRVHPEDFTEFCFRVASRFVLAGMPREARAVAAQEESEALRCVFDAWRALVLSPEDRASLCAALLHDVVLDLGGSVQQARLVAALTERAS